MNNVTLLGIDLAKNVFQVCAEDSEGNQLFNRRYTRSRFNRFIQTTEPCAVAMEACGSSHYWARELQALGHQVKLISPRRVKGYVRRNKTDANDAAAICEAATSKRVPTVAIKSVAQQQVSSLHQARRQLVKRRTQLTNHVRGQLAEYGLVTGCGYSKLRAFIAELLADNPSNLPAQMLFVLQDMAEEWQRLDKRIRAYDAQIKRVASTDPVAKKLLAMPGVGEITATAIVAKVADVSVFSNGSYFAAWLGLTPKEYTSAKRRYVGGISKQGDRYLRTLLIHGARASLRATLRQDNNQTAYHRWVRQLHQRVGTNKAVVAMANKHARMMWALIRHNRTLDLDYVTTLITASAD